jgi:hypothetical protein
MAKGGRVRRWTDDQLTNAVSRAKSVSGVFRELGLRIGGGQHMLIKKRIRELKLDTSHFTGQGWNKGDAAGLLRRKCIPLEEILVRDSEYCSISVLKRRLVDAGLLDNRCAICGLLPEWQGKPLIMRLDHINGICNDHRLPNLRFLCPNCDSQTPTFAGRNKGKPGVALELTEGPSAAPTAGTNRKREKRRRGRPPEPAEARHTDDPVE